jgi:hypothetical protein
MKRRGETRQDVRQQQDGALQLPDGAIMIG